MQDHRRLAADGTFARKTLKSNRLQNRNQSRWFESDRSGCSRRGQPGGQAQAVETRYLYKKKHL